MWFLKWKSLADMRNPGFQVHPILGVRKYTKRQNLLGFQWRKWTIIDFCRLYKLGYHRLNSKFHLSWKHKKPLYLDGILWDEFRTSDELEIRKRHTTIALDAARKQHQVAYDINNKSKYFLDRKLKNSIEEGSINVISVRRLGFQVQRQLLAGFAILET